MSNPFLRDKVEVMVVFRSFPVCWPPIWLPADAPLLRERQQLSSHPIQIDQAADGGKPIGVLGNPAVAHLPEAEHALERMKGMLAAGTHLRLGAIGRPIGFA